MCTLVWQWMLGYKLRNGSRMIFGPIFTQIWTCFQLPFGPELRIASEAESWIKLVYVMNTHKLCVTSDYTSADNSESYETPAGWRKSFTAWFISRRKQPNQACGGTVVHVTTLKELISMIIPVMGNSPGNSGGFLQAIVVTRWGEREILKECWSNFLFIWITLVLLEKREDVNTSLHIKFSNQLCWLLFLLL